MQKEENQAKELQNKVVNLVNDVEKLEQKALLGEVFMHFICSGDQAELLSPECVDKFYASYLHQLTLINEAV